MVVPEAGRKEYLFRGVCIARYNRGELPVMVRVGLQGGIEARASLACLSAAGCVRSPRHTTRRPLV